MIRLGVERVEDVQCGTRFKLCTERRLLFEALVVCDRCLKSLKTVCVQKTSSPQAARLKQGPLFSSQLFPSRNVAPGASLSNIEQMLFRFSILLLRPVTKNPSLLDILTRHKSRKKSNEEKQVHRMSHRVGCHLWDNATTVVDV
jgi:hypothetical protein